MGLKNNESLTEIELNLPKIMNFNQRITEITESNKTLKSIQLRSKHFTNSICEKYENFELGCFLRCFHRIKKIDSRINAVPYVDRKSSGKIRKNIVTVDNEASEIPEGMGYFAPIFSHTVKKKLRQIQ